MGLGDAGPGVTAELSGLNTQRTVSASSGDRGKVLDEQGGNQKDCGLSDVQEETGWPWVAGDSYSPEIRHWPVARLNAVAKEAVQVRLDPGT